MRAQCFTSFKQEVACMVFRVRVGVDDIKENFKRKYDGDLNCLFCRQIHENSGHIFSAPQGFSAGGL